MISYPDPFFADEEGRTELMRCALAGDLSAVEKIIFALPGTGIFCQRFALIRKTDNHDQNAIMLAREAGHEDVAELLRKEHDRMYWYE